MTLGQRIALCRKQSGMTQEDLGEKLGVSRQAVSKWESEQTTPDLQYLKAMCELFHVTADWLLFEKDFERVQYTQEPEIPEMESCPHCSEPVLSGAAFCPKCGQSMAPLDRPGCYTLVLKKEAVGNTAVYDSVRELYVKGYGTQSRSISIQEAEKIVDSAPMILCCGLDGKQVKEALEIFWMNSHLVEVYRDESASKSLNELKESGAVPLANAAFQKKESNGLGFWGVVGAVVVAILIMSIL